VCSSYDIRACLAYSYCDNEEHFFINLLQPNPSVHAGGDYETDMTGHLYFTRLSKVLCAQYFFYLDLHMQDKDSGNDNWSALQWNLTDSIPLRTIGPDSTHSSFYQPRLGVHGHAAEWITDGAFEAGPFAKGYQYGPLPLSLYRYDCRVAERRKPNEKKRNTTGEVRHCHLQPGSAGMLDWDYTSQMWHLSDHEKFICKYPIRLDSEHTITATNGNGDKISVTKAANDWGNTKLIAMYVPPDDTPPESQLSSVLNADKLKLQERIEHAMHEGGDKRQLYSVEDVQKYGANRMFAFWRARAMPSVAMKTPHIVRNGSSIVPGDTSRTQVVGTPPLYAAPATEFNIMPTTGRNVKARYLILVLSYIALSRILIVIACDLRTTN
jgi:hypothetical protein